MRFGLGFGCCAGSGFGLELGCEGKAQGQVIGMAKDTKFLGMEKSQIPAITLAAINLVVIITLLSMMNAKISGLRSEMTAMRSELRSDFSAHDDCAGALITDEVEINANIAARDENVTRRLPNLEREQARRPRIALDRRPPFPPCPMPRLACTV